ncbi:MAG: hypothetical protein NZ853_02820 [Leptospiraceae bacterium]|nr:hypothetical protein [Leptospiraceae bacterium]MDW7975108.1 hypothetical protein [Leptospiraceae bacterium]
MRFRFNIKYYYNLHYTLSPEHEFYCNGLVLKKTSDIKSYIRNLILNQQFSELKPDTFLIKPIKEW